MTLAELTSRKAVLEAIKEYDRVGREAFLSSYGFGEAREYFLVYERRRYDSKAIVGAAHGYQFRGQPLLGADFAGGDKTVKRKREALGFTVEKSGTKHRNPPWVRDELILALELYLRRGRRMLDEADPEVIELSKILNSLPIHVWRDSMFRNPAGVSMKLANFRRLDPNRSTNGRGLARGNSLEPLIWDEFAGDVEQLHALAEAIKGGTDTPTTQAGEEEEEQEFPEGRIIYRLHRARERSRQAVQRRKEMARGKLHCQACGFDFAAAYGQLGEGYIECHHIEPVSQLRADHKTKPSELALVCANCHRMLHRRRPWLGLVELEQLVSDRRTSR